MITMNLKDIVPAHLGWRAALDDQLFSLLQNIDDLRLVLQGIVERWKKFIERKQVLR